MIIELDQQDDVCVLRFKGRLASGQDLEYLLAKKEKIKKLSCAKVPIFAKCGPLVQWASVFWLLFTPRLPGTRAVVSCR